MSTNQIQARVPLYYKWVILSLLGTRGKNKSDVLAWIIGDWIGLREKWLRRNGLSEKDYREWQKQGPTRVSKDRADVAPLDSHRRRQ